MAGNLTALSYPIIWAKVSHRGQEILDSTFPFAGWLSFEAKLVTDRWLLLLWLINQRKVFMYSMCDLVCEPERCWSQNLSCLLFFACLPSCQVGKHDEAWMILKQIHDTNMRARGQPEKVFTVSFPMLKEAKKLMFCHHWDTCYRFHHEWSESCLLPFRLICCTLENIVRTSLIIFCAVNLFSWNTFITFTIKLLLRISNLSHAFEKP